MPDTEATREPGTLSDIPRPSDDPSFPWRFHPLEVVAKYEGSHGYGLVYLRPPSVSGESIDPYRAPWTERATDGSPLTLHLSPGEMEQVYVGDLFAVTIHPYTDNREGDQ